MNNVPKKPFFQRTWVIVVLLFLFAPAGIFLLWKNMPQWKKGAKIALSVVCGLFWILAAFSGGSSSNVKDNTPLPAVEARQHAEAQAPETEDNASTPESSEAEPNTSDDAILADNQESNDSEPAQDFVVSTPDEPGEAQDRSTLAPEPDPEPTPTQPTSYVYVGSIESDKYHYPSCQHAQTILDENLIGWYTIAEAEAAGYKPCGTCKPR